LLLAAHAQAIAGQLPDFGASLSAGAGGVDGSAAGGAFGSAGGVLAGSVAGAGAVVSAGGVSVAGGAVSAGGGVVASPGGGSAGLLQPETNRAPGNASASSRAVRNGRLAVLEFSVLMDFSSLFVGGGTEKPRPGFENERIENEKGRLAPPLPGVRCKGHRFKRLLIVIATAYLSVFGSP
jgi:hypothetical protein